MTNVNRYTTSRLFYYISSPLPLSVKHTEDEEDTPCEQYS